MSEPAKGMGAAAFEKWWSSVSHEGFRRAIAKEIFGAGFDVAQPAGKVTAEMVKVATEHARYIGDWYKAVAESLTSQLGTQGERPQVERGVCPTCQSFVNSCGHSKMRVYSKPCNDGSGMHATICGPCQSASNSVTVSGASAQSAEPKCAEHGDNCSGYGCDGKAVSEPEPAKLGRCNYHGNVLHEKSWNCGDWKVGGAAAPAPTCPECKHPAHDKRICSQQVHGVFCFCGVRPPAAQPSTESAREFTKQACGHITRGHCSSCLKCSACCIGTRTCAPAESRHLAHAAYQSLLRKAAEWDEKDWDRSNKFERHAINAALDLQEAEARLSEVRAATIEECCKAMCTLCMCNFLAVHHTKTGVEGFPNPADHDGVQWFHRQQYKGPAYYMPCQAAEIRSLSAPQSTEGK